MLKRRFIISWFLSSIIMFVLGMLWHGVILTDLQFIPAPKHVFYSLAALAYIVVGFALTFTFTYLSLGIGMKMKGSLMGVALGFFIYLIAFVFGVTFKGGATQHIVVDFLWQMIEQGVGGGVVGTVYMLARRRDQVLGKG